MSKENSNPETTEIVIFDWDSTLNEAARQTRLEYIDAAAKLAEHITLKNPIPHIFTKTKQETQEFLFGSITELGEKNWQLVQKACQEQYDKYKLDFINGAKEL